MFKKIIAVSLFSSLALSGSENLHSSQTRKISDLFHRIEQYFHKPSTLIDNVILPIPQLWDAKVLSPFQILFRETIQFTDKTNNILCTVAQKVIQEAQEEYYSMDQAVHRFLQEIQEGGSYLINQALIETLDIDLENTIPHFLATKSYIQAIQHTIGSLQQDQIIAQIQELVHYAEATQKNAELIQKEGVLALTSQLTSHALFGTSSPLVEAFGTLYHVYPTTIAHIEKLRIQEAGLQVHALFNLSSELVEQLIFLNSSIGKIGRLFIHEELISSLDAFKNQVRKLGNAIEFVTSTEPLIVVAPPTTPSAMLEIVETFLWRDGNSLRISLMTEIEKTIALLQTTLQAVPGCQHDIEKLERSINHLSERMYDNFINKLKEAPLLNIPQCPVLLLELVEEEIASIKNQLEQLVNQSIIMIDYSCNLCVHGAHLLSYTNTFMGGTDKHPFIHPDIIRGLGFIKEDAGDLSEIIQKLMQEIKTFSLRYTMNERDC